ncbi:MAG TPA: ABC transporter ATP-binding protein [Anaerolineae bacterium]|nr:ABC transporter ATP-binding protein [Anaerolineae bacterium]HIQ04194.1 ABC transporter ATP-binding protein [Anaerolineae bacterium]
MAEIILQNVTKVFGSGSQNQVVAVDDLTLTIRDQEFFSLLGPSGCGKTTTLRLIAGFERPTQGQVVIDGQVVNDVPPNRRQIGIVFQSYALFPHLSVFENCAFGLRARGLPNSQIREKVMEVLSLVRLADMADRRPSQLSGGQQQRVAIARSLAIEPRILLFDEPLSNLDAKLRVEMRGELVALQRRLGITAIYVTHDQEEALAISDRVAVLDAGRLQQVGKPWELYEHPRTRFVADFLGRTNLMEATVLDRTANGLLHVRTTHGFELYAGRGSLERVPGETVWLTIKAEKLQIHPGSVVEGSNRLVGTVTEMQYIGPRLDLAIHLDSDPVLLASSEPRLELRHLRIGDQVTVQILPEDLYVI